MSKDYAYNNIKTTAIDLRKKVTGVDGTVIIPLLPDTYINNASNKASILKLAQVLISLKPYKDTDSSTFPLETQALYREISYFFDDAEKFYSDVTGHSPNYNE